jgi:hypothetical protein
MIDKWFVDELRLSILYVDIFICFLRPPCPLLHIEEYTVKLARHEYVLTSHTTFSSSS